MTANNNILLSGVGEPFFEQNIRYHCPIYCVLNFNKKPYLYSKSFLYNRGNYKAFKKDLHSTDWNSLKHDNVDTYVSNVTDKVLELTNKHMPNKMIKVRQSDPSWLNNNIKRLIRKKKRLYEKYKHTDNINDCERYKQVRNKVTSEIRKTKSEEVKHLATKLENTNIGQKDWWRTLKQFIKPEQTAGFPPLSHDDKI